MPQGKILAIAPKLNNGVQDVWSPPGKAPLYTSLISIEGTGEGTIKSQTPTPKWKIGAVISFEIGDKRTPDGYAQFIKLNEVTPAAGEAKKSSYNDPANNKRMALGMAHNFANLTIRNLESRLWTVPYIVDDPDPEVSLHKTMVNIFSIARKYYMWITKEETIDDRDTLSRRWYAVNYGVDCILMEHIFNGVQGATDKVLKIAEMQFEDTMKIVAK